MRRAGLIALLVLLGACSAEAPPDPPTTTAPTTSRAPWRTEDLGARMGALSTMLTYCIPGLAPDRPCDFSRLSPMIGELTAGVRATVEDGSHPEVVAASTALDQANAAFVPCTAWFNSSAATLDPTCDTLWYALNDSWHRFLDAAGWG